MLKKLTRKALGNTPRYIPCAYGDPIPDVFGKSVLIADFSFSAPIIQSMRERSANFVLLDHHKYLSSCSLLITIKDSDDGTRE